MNRAKTSHTSASTLLLVAALTCCLPTGRALAACAIPPAGDADCDGLADAVDPCPADTLNRCNGPIAICATAPPGAQDCPAGSELRLDLGGTGASVDCNLETWSLDSGAGSTSTAAFVLPTAPIQNAFGCTSTPTEAIVSSEKFGGQITRSYPVADGEYTVNLLFAETFQGACVVASRTMDVSIEGQQVLGGAAARDGFDTYLTSLIQNGAIDACGGLVIRSFRVTVTGGALDITITEDDPAAGDVNAAIKGIEVLEFIDGCLSNAECDDGDVCTEDICNAQHDCENLPGALDTDGDGACDPLDICPDDGLDDIDGDGHCAGSGFNTPAVGDGDNCADITNADQADADGDGRGDVCDQCATDTGAAEDACLGLGFWEPMAGNQVARGEGGLAAVGSRIFLIGGEQPAAGRSVEIYDTGSDSWSTGPQLPGIGPDNLGRNHIQPVVVGSKIYVFGGLTTTFRDVIAETIVLDTDDLGAGWQQHAPMPTPRGSSACAARGVLVYCAGGVVDGPAGVDPAVDTFEIYNTVADAWTSGPSMPRARDSAYAHIIGDEIILVSGRDTFTNTVVPFTDIYDITGQSWRGGAPPPLARGGYASAVLEGRVLVIGGELGVGAGGPPDGVLPDVHEYDPARNSWRALLDVPTPRHGFMGAVTTDAGGKPRIHTISGGTVQGFSASTAHEALFFGECSTALDCDDGNACTDDLCVSGSCQNPNNVAPCDDGLFCNGADLCLDGACIPGVLLTCDDGIDCTVDSCDELIGACVNTPTDLVCDDGSFCNGAETCDAITGCLPGAPVLCDDGVNCTTDACDEAADACTAAPDDTACNDGIFCNGAETCDVTTGCSVDAAFTCDDGVDCTIDRCNETAGACDHTPDDGVCNDGLFCTGTETCNTAGCQPGAPVDCDDGVACTMDVCNESADTCFSTASDTLCADGVACTLDTCDETSGCVHAADDGVCNDGEFCNGTELCDVLTDCRAGIVVDCEDGVGCTLDDCDEALGACVSVATDPLCDDGAFCNGAETCDAVSDCQAGVPPATDDGIACTVDSCDETTDTIVNTVDHAACDDGDFCNGAETCDAAGGCQIASPVDCDDGVACTIDSCDELADSCASAADDGACDDGEFCNGTELCDVLTDCRAGIVVDCEDGVGCTLDDCDEALGACVSVATDPLCDDGAFCNGAETCDAVSDCQAGVPPATDDGIACTVDSCDETTDTIVNTVDHAACDDGDFCNGAETCDAAGGCQIASPVDCDDGVACTIDSCDELADSCASAADDGACDDGDACNGPETCDAGAGCRTGVAPLCDDGNPCTAESCDAALGCSSAPLAAGSSCADGAFCNGSETCDGAGGCVAGVAPVMDDGIQCTADACDETTDTVTHTAIDTACDDGLFCNGTETCDAAAGCLAGTSPTINDGVNCTFDTCDETADAVVHITIDAVCDDGSFCNGNESCDATAGCQAGTPVQIDDGVDCTVDTCDEAADVVTHSTSDVDCDDGLFCNGLETCDMAAGCRAGNAVICEDDVDCTVDACDESTDVCTATAADTLCDDGQACNGAETCDASVGCLGGADIDCDDGIDCTIDSCDDTTGDCIATPADAPCDDGLFCNGVEICDLATGCTSGEPVDCDDGVACTIDVCNESTDVCGSVAWAPRCDDGLFCNGVEICDAELDCLAGTSPCDDGIECTVDSCDDASDSCDATAENALCDDGNACTANACDATTGCAHPALEAGVDCDDGMFCNGVDTCDGTGTCTTGAVPQPSDGIDCTLDSCDEAGRTIVHEPRDVACDDGLFCTGAETCDGSSGCVPGTPPDVDDGIDCTVDFCDEDARGAGHTPTNPRCDDGVFCNGTESCDTATGCTSGAPVDVDDGIGCTVDTCDEVADAIVHTPTDSACDDGMFCNGAETCDAGTGCAGGTAVDCDDGVGCTLDACDETFDDCVSVETDLLCDDGAFCNGAETCDAAADCQAGVPPATDDGVDCTVDACEEATDTVVHTPTDSTCDDGLFCNGIETCDTTAGCAAGTTVDCDDGIDCTTDACDEASAACMTVASDAACDDGLFCNGVETCDAATDCQPGTPPTTDDGVACTVDTCEEATDTVAHTPTDSTCDDGLFCNGIETCDTTAGCAAGTAVDCDDGIDCTTDACDEASVACTTVTSDAACDDGLFCNGTEICDATTGCLTGDAPDANDSVDCTIDACDENADTVTHTADDSTCDDGAFCNGSETCDATAGCLIGDAPDLDDGVDCTIDACDENADAATHVTDDGSCDDGAFCNGTEACDAAAGCLIGDAPDLNDGVDCTIDACDEIADTVTHIADNGACDDGVFCNGTETCDATAGCLTGDAPDFDDGIDCTIDACDENADAATHVTDDGSCDDGAFCNGTETCDATAGCLTGDAPDLDDGIDCTIDACDENADAATHVTDDGSCDDGAFCNGTETCDAAAGCLTGDAPDLDDGIDCTIDACDENADVATHVTDDGSCDDGAFCNGTETCDAAAGCLTGDAPDLDDGVDCTIDACDENADAATHVTDDGSCDDGAFCNGTETCDATAGCLTGDAPDLDDGVDCTIDACDENADAATHTADDSTCDDGAFCNGTETCDATAGCLTGDAPDLDDGVDCTIDACDENADAATHTADDSTCDDGAFCNGTETCDATAGCLTGDAPDLDDGVDCTIDACDENADAATHTADDSTCDDGAFCNGTETCDATAGCLTGDAPDLDDGVDCTIDACDENADAATHTADDSTCDDGAFCNGTETCDATAGCLTGDARDVDDGVDCTIDACDENADAATHTADDSTCDDGAFCNGTETCDATAGCLTGDAPDVDDGVDCTIDTCDEATDAAVHQPAPAACDDGIFCNGAEGCDPNVGCVGGAMPCDDGVPCTVDACDESSLSCSAMASDAACDDGTACNGLETCDPVSGCAVGAAPTCEDLDTQCASGICSETEGGCVTVASRETEPCFDDNACTIDDLCTNGACVGSSQCGVPISGSGTPVVSDGLYILRAAVGLGTCTICRCDTNGDMRITVADSLVATRIAVGLEGSLACRIPEDGAPAATVSIDGTAADDWSSTSTTLTTLSTSTSTTHPPGR